MAKAKSKTKTPVPPANPLSVTHPTNHLLLGIICCIAAMVLYSYTIGSDYTVDDGTVIENNKHTTAGIKSLPVIFSSAYRAGFWPRKEGLYRPLSVAMFAIEWQLAPHHPWLGHLINVLLYILTAWVLYNLMRKLLHSHHPLIPFFITLLYIVLPVHSEVVANIKSRDEIMCFLFIIISFDQLLKWLNNNKVTSLLFASIAYFIALLSKESAVTMIAVYPLIIYYFSKSDSKKIVMPSLLFLGIACVFLGIRYAVLGTMGGSDVIQLINNSLMGTDDKIIRFASAVHIMGRYLGLLIAPVTLIFDYSYNTIPLVSITSWKALLPLLIYTTLLVFAIKNFNKKNPIVFGIFFFLITIALVSNIFFLIEATLAERFLYIPSLGFCIAFVIALATYVKKPTKPSGTVFQQIRSSPVFILLTVLIIIYSGRTIARTLDWKNNITLLAKDVKSAPNSSRIRYAYGSALLIEKALKEKDTDKKKQYLQASVNELEKGVALIEDYSEAWYHLGVAYKELDDAGNAIRAFEKCRSYKPFTEPEKLIASGLAYGMAKQYDKALADFNEALKFDSTSTEAMNNLGLYYNDAGKFKESVELLSRAIRMKPDFKMAYYNLGNTYAKVGDYRSAMNYYLYSIKLDASYGDALNNIGNCYSAMNMRDSARIYYEKATTADPSNTKAMINMGVVLSETGDTANGKIWFEKARALGATL